jgi:myosin-5
MSVNPFKSIPLYTDELRQLYHSAKSFSDLPPHIYAITEQIYRQVQDEHKDQAVIIRCKNQHCFRPS